MEHWADVPDFEGLYKVSNLGNVKRCEKFYCCGHGGKTIRKLGEQVIIGDCARGYKRVCLYKNGKHTRVLLHRLVAKVFVQNPNNMPEIDHVDGNPLNNRSDNLRWCNHKGNMSNLITRKRKSIAAKRNNHMTGRFGVLHHNSKMVQCIETGTVYGGIAEAERATGFGHISSVCRGIRETAGGYHWKYIYERSEK